MLAAGQAHLRAREAESTGAGEAKPALAKKGSSVAIAATNRNTSRPAPPKAPPPPPKVENWLESGGLKTLQEAKTRALKSFQSTYNTAKEADAECSQKENKAVDALMKQMQELIAKHTRDQQCGNRLAKASEELLEKTQREYDTIVAKLETEQRGTHELLEEAQKAKSGGDAEHDSKLNELAIQIRTLQEERNSAAKKHQAAMNAAKAASDKALAQLEEKKTLEIKTLTDQKTKVDKQLAEKNKTLAAAKEELAAESTKLRTEIARLEKQKKEMLDSSQSATKDLQAAKKQIESLADVQKKIEQIEKVLYPSGKPCNDKK